MGYMGLFAYVSLSLCVYVHTLKRNIRAGLGGAAGSSFGAFSFSHNLDEEREQEMEKNWNNKEDRNGCKSSNEKYNRNDTSDKNGTSKAISAIHSEA